MYASKQHISLACIWTGYHNIYLPLSLATMERKRTRYSSRSLLYVERVTGRDLIFQRRGKWESGRKKGRKKWQGVPIMAQWKWLWLVPMRTQVQSLSSLSGLRIQCCHQLWCGSQMQLGSGIAVAVALASSCSSHLTPAWELPYAVGAALKRQ